MLKFGQRKRRIFNKQHRPRIARIYADINGRPVTPPSDFSFPDFHISAFLYIGGASSASPKFRPRITRIYADQNGHRLTLDVECSSFPRSALQPLAFSLQPFLSPPPSENRERRTFNIEHRTSNIQHR